MPSGRGAIEQPNATSDGQAALTPTFWLAIVVTGIVSGLGGVAMMALLFKVEHVAFGYHSGSFLTGVEHASGLRRFISVTLAGVVGGVGWYLLRRFTKGQSAEVDHAIWAGTGQLSVARSLGTSVISEIVVGMGASLGREAAPKLLGGTAGTVFARFLNLSGPQRRLLVACGAGAGLACVYNVPLGAACFTAEILCGSIALPTVMPALACSAIATATAWVYLPSAATYPNIPTFHATAALIVWAFLLAPIVGLFASAYVRVIGWVSHHRVKGSTILFAMPATFALLGLIGLAYPQLFGNGKGVAHEAFLGHGTLLLLLALFVLKPAVTALCLGAGASGGLLTPVMSTGAVLGGFLGLAFSHVWHGTPIGSYALVGAAAMIGAAMQAPLTAVVVIMELTHSGLDLAVPMIAATVIATAIARHVDGYSIYSARLPALET
jgi:CIC family chloride channel protein